MTTFDDPRLTYGLTNEQLGPDDLICAYIGDVQVAGAVKISDAYAEQTGCQYHITSHITGSLKPLLCRDRDQAILWLIFLADLYEGKMR